MSPILFLIVAALTIGSALTVVLHPSPVYSALGLVGTLGLIAVLFLALGAQAVGFLQIIVYAGAIVVLFLFVIMLLNLQSDPHTLSAPTLVAVGTAGSVVLAGTLVAGIARGPVATPALGDHFGEMAMLAERLFTAYLLPFELTSILLLVAIIGAVVIGKRSLS